MLVKRFFDLPDGSTTFDEVEIPVSNHSSDAWGNEISRSMPFVSHRVSIFRISEDAFQDWHNAPERQLCGVLEGVWEVETTDGQRHAWTPGQLFLPDDVNGRGHISRVKEGPVTIMFVPLPPDLDLTTWTMTSTGARTTD